MDKHKKPRVLGVCCVCGQPCLAGDRITAAAPGCLVRHTDCIPKPKEQGLSERRR